MHHSRSRHQLSTLSGIICYFSCINWFVVRAKWPWNCKALQNELWKVWNLAWYHHFTHIACAKKKRGLRQKQDELRVQTRQSLLKYQGFWRKNTPVTTTLHFFKLIWTPNFFCVPYAPFKARSSIFNTFWHHLIFSVIYRFV